MGVRASGRSQAVAVKGQRQRGEEKGLGCQLGRQLEMEHRLLTHPHLCCGT